PFEGLHALFVLLTGRLQFGVDLLPRTGDVPASPLTSPDSFQNLPHVSLGKVLHWPDRHLHPSRRQVGLLVQHQRAVLAQGALYLDGVGGHGSAPFPRFTSSYRRLAIEGSANSPAASAPRGSARCPGLACRGCSGILRRQA